MVSQSLLNNTNVQVTSALGGMQVLEYVQDMSVSPSTSKLQYYMSRMNVNKRQLDQMRLEYARKLDAEKYANDRTVPLTDEQRAEMEAQKAQKGKKKK